MMILLLSVNWSWKDLKIFLRNWCELYDHMVTQPTIKIEIWSRKVKRGLIGLWHNENLSKDTSTIRIKLNDALKLVNLQ